MRSLPPTSRSFKIDTYQWHRAGTRKPAYYRQGTGLGRITPAVVSCDRGPIPLSLTHPHQQPGIEDEYLTAIQWLHYSMFLPLNQSLSGTRLISATWRNVSIRSAPRFAPLRPLTRVRRLTASSILLKTAPSTTTTTTTPTPGVSDTTNHTTPQPNNGMEVICYKPGTVAIEMLTTC